MTRFRNFYEPSATTQEKSIVKKSLFGKITTVESLVENGGVCFTNDIKTDLRSDPVSRRRLIRVVSSQINYFFKKYKVRPSDLVLTAGVGNEKLTVDSLGCLTTEKLRVTAHIYKEKGFIERIGNLSCVKCGVSGMTGIESFVHLSALCDKLRPKIVIAVDTLAAGSPTRLGSAIQISDLGITPGKGVNNAKRELSYSSLAVPVIGIGVPLVIYANKIVAEYVRDSDAVVIKGTIDDLVVAANDADILAEDFSFVIAEAINEAVHDREQ